jgi:hypothetical protein
MNNHRNGASGYFNSEEFKQAATDSGMSEENFKKAVGANVSSITGGSLDKTSVSGLDKWGLYWGHKDSITVTLPGGASYNLEFSHSEKGNVAEKDVSDKLNEIVGEDPKNGWIAMYDSVPYIYVDDYGKWYKLANKEDSFSKDYLNKLRQYKSGGLADFTGPAWLDGTKSKPEIVLNQRDSANFLILRDILSEALNGGKVSENNSHSGDNHFDIEINVEKLESDYDVEQLADKIRRMLYDDATYRNVNAIGLLR